MNVWGSPADPGCALRNYLHDTVLPVPILAETMADVAVSPGRTLDKARQTEKGPRKQISQRPTCRSEMGVSRAFPPQQVTSPSAGRGTWHLVANPCAGVWHDACTPQSPGLLLWPQPRSPEQADRGPALHCSQSGALGSRFSVSQPPGSPS